MTPQVVQDWTEIRIDDDTVYQYRVTKDGTDYNQQVRRPDGVEVGAFDLPEGVKMDRQSYEVLLRYALSQTAA